MLRDDALQIWRAGVDAVRPDRLIREHVRLRGWRLEIAGEAIDLRPIRKIAVVGAGKAGAAMAAAVESIFGPEIAAEKQLTGWINVPADCANLPLSHIHLHPARPAGRNEPTPEAAFGAEQILNIVSNLQSDDLCIVLISGGGSALLPAPTEGITLADKLAVTRLLSAAGADIAELNTVRQSLSRIKGGGLARACRAGQLVALILSDVPGDALHLIASGPTTPESVTPQDALEVLEQFRLREAGLPKTVFEVLARRAGHSDRAAPPSCRVSNIIIGSNATAVEAAAAEARRLGYLCEAASASKPEGAVEKIGRHLADLAVVLRDRSQAHCFISGGEGTVCLAPEQERGLGGRNQQTVLAALVRLSELDPRGIVIVSGGTDGEDGPTDAAGALVDTRVISDAMRHGLDARDYLRRNDAYHFFQPLDALIKTGPTHTNVCDLRVVLAKP